MEEPINTPIPSPSLNTPSDKLFKIASIIIGLLIVIGLFLNVYLLLKKEKPASPTPVSVIPTSTPAISETTNLNEYKNDILGFSFKYPSDWSLKPYEISTTYPLHGLAQLTPNVQSGALGESIVLS